MNAMQKDWAKIGTLDDIPPLGARVVRTPVGCVAVFRAADDNVYAIEDRCPHRGGPLSQGIVHGTSVTCPLHNMVISLENGAAQGADNGSVRTFPIRVDDGVLYLDISRVMADGRA